MKKKLLWTLVLATLALLLWGGTRAWQRQRDHAVALAQDETARQSLRIRLAPDDITMAERRRMPLQVPASGSLRALESVSIRAQYGGQIQDLRLREGEPVRAGQVLFSIAAEDAAARLQQARQQAQAAQAEWQMAQRDADNSRALAGQGFISPTALANSEARQQAARANHQAALAGVEVARKGLGDSRATSPLDGVVARRHLQTGEVVSAGQAVLDIVDVRHFELQAEVSAQDALHVRASQPAQLQVEGLRAPLPAEVTRISPATQSGSRSVPVFLRVLPDVLDGGQAAAAPLRDGLFARGEITTGEVDAVLVPQTAIRTDRPLPYVLLLTEDRQRILHRTVQVGARMRAGGQVWVAVEGLADGTPILTGAAGLLSDGTLVQVDEPPAANSPIAAPAGAAAVQP
ncbi:efflux RND transporter periplasmic adaptor subunit [Corticibacter populi]|nr:efflux RND transporter periplasmic adaptor subunit [Corticibacter populi]RZS29922.1 RND family efflux transporter MFP subunit [Corticibacter populi]